MSRQLLEQAVACRLRGAWADAERLLRAYLQSSPDDIDALGELGDVLCMQSRFVDAAEIYRRAIRRDPTRILFHFNLGTALLYLRDFAAAEAPLRRAVELAPAMFEAHNNLGNALQALKRYDDAANIYRHVLRLNPRDLRAYCNLGNVLRECGAIDETLACLRQATELDPSVPLLLSNYLYSLQFHPAHDSLRYKADLALWRTRFADPLRPLRRPHSLDRSPDRPLRIGFVSPNFSDHVVGRNILPLFRHLDRSQFLPVCYAEPNQPDHLTAEFRRLAAAFRLTTGINDQTLAEQIRNDRIDILVDLALHMVGNRLPVFAYKPAPIQVTFAGYPGSTGLDTIDYRLSDPFLDPPAPPENDALYSEKTFRLPATFWCYDPLRDSAPITPGPLPAAANGTITFCCLNHFFKVNEPTLDLWARALRQIPGSRLLLLAPDGAHRARTVQFLHSRGIAPERIRFAPKCPRPDYLRLYHQADIGLDTLPYNGHTTSLDALWMGVPVVTLVGNSVIGRAGYSQLMNLNLPELITTTPDAFVAAVTALAGDLPRLQTYRTTLRPRMEQSPLMDAPAFTRAIESAFRTMWRQTCAAP